MALNDPEQPGQPATHEILGPDGSVVGVMDERGHASDYSEVYRQAIAQLEREDFSGAEQTYRRLVLLEPEKAEPHYGLGGALRLQRRYPEARTHYEKALAIDPRSHGSLEGLGFLSLEEDQPLVASSYYDRALAIDPRDLSSLSGAAKARIRLGRCKDAADLVRRWHEGATESRKRQGLDLDDLLAACREDAGSLSSVGTKDSGH